MHKPLMDKPLSRLSFAALSAAAVFNLQSCSDNDTPLPEVNDKRLVGRWTLGGGTVMDDMDSNIVVYFEFEKPDKFKLLYEYDYGTSGYGYSYSGKWEWANAAKDSLLAIVDFDTLAFRVDKFTATELDLTQSQYGYTQTWEFESAD